MRVLCIRTLWVLRNTGSVCLSNLFNEVTALLITIYQIQLLNCDIKTEIHLIVYMLIICDTVILFVTFLILFIMYLYA